MLSNLLILPKSLEHSELLSFLKIMVGEETGMLMTRNPMMNTKWVKRKIHQNGESVLIAFLSDP